MLGHSYWICMAEAQSNDLQRNMVMTTMCQAFTPLHIISNQQKSAAILVCGFYFRDFFLFPKRQHSIVLTGQTQKPED